MKLSIILLDLFCSKIAIHVEETGSTGRGSERYKKPIARLIRAPNILLGDCGHRTSLRNIFGKVKKLDSMSKISRCSNPSVPDTPNWRISAFKKRLRETDAS